MQTKQAIPPIQVESDLKDWVIEQALEDGLKIGPWIRQLLMNIKNKKIKLVYQTEEKRQKTRGYDE